ncbi:MAG TPA: oligoribonuclease [Verrucomicrobiae bacterium]|nr:oligoribonuclease [Verrucomicrobiae bacterium]
MTKHATILWVDLEMTGLNADADLILEVAAIATDWNFTELAVYEGIVKSDPSVLKQKFATNGVFWEANAETRDALLAQNEKGKNAPEIEQELLAFLKANFKEDAPVLLGGNSVHMDRRFILKQWPQLDAKLHYRMLDVSAWKVVFEGKYGKKFAKPEVHRALEDIRGSIMELKYYLTKVQPAKKLP